MVKNLNKFGVLRITPETINNTCFLLMISNSSFVKCAYMQSNP
jgi:hypothetical protein